MYNSSNSLSPMMFKKKTKGDSKGTRSERFRSKSVENIADTPNFNQLHISQQASANATCTESTVWKDVAAVKAQNPVIVCILPSLSIDFVASAVLAIGASPLVIEDPADVAINIPVSSDSCRAILVDVSAPQLILEQFLTVYEIGSFPVILVASESGTNNRKKDLAARVVDECAPSFITGKLVDIFALSQTILEKAASRAGSSDSDDDKPTSAPPQVVLSMDKGNEVDISAGLPPALRRANRFRRSTSPAVSPGSSPVISPAGSPRTSPPDSSTNSPRASPVSSPVLKKRGIAKLISKKKRAASVGTPLKRVPTMIPRVAMKGQFRDTKHHNVKTDEAIDSAQKLAAHTKATINIIGLGTLTDGEVVVEITNSQTGLGNVHSLLSVCGAVVGGVLACIESKGDDVKLSNCVHAMALYHVAAEEAAIISTSSSGLTLPGSLRVNMLNALNYLTENEVQSKAVLRAHTEGIQTPYKC